MKLALAALAVMLSSLVSAQTVTTVSFPPAPAGIQVDAPCANFGKGQSMFLKARWERMYHTVQNADGTQNGFFMQSGKTLAGRGFTNGHWYYADGTINVIFVNQNPNSGDGSYDVSVDLQIVSTVGTKETERFLYHQRQRYTWTLAHNELTFDVPTEVVCK